MHMIDGAAFAGSDGAFDSIGAAIEDIRAGKMIIVVEDQDLENQGDLVMAAEKMTPAAVDFMLKFGGRLICVPVSTQRAQQLKLAHNVAADQENHGTEFTVSVNAAEGITTGEGAGDRAHTIQLLSSNSSWPTDIVRPGYVFPLTARDGGVLQRAGPAEAAVDLARLAGFDSSAVICEITRENGETARLPDLIEFKKKHFLKLCTIQDLVSWRRAYE